MDTVCWPVGLNQIVRSLFFVCSVVFMLCGGLSK